MGALLKYNIVIILILLGAVYSFAQEKMSIGKISYLASDNVYVKFISTDKFEIGDTLWQTSSEGLVPVLRLKKKSSTSCICEKISDIDVELNQELQHITRAKNELLEDIEELETVSVDTSIEDVKDSELQIESYEDPSFQQDIRGRFSLASYSNLSSQEGEDKHRMLARLSINANNINDSRFSLESYLNYRQNFLNSLAAENTENKFFRIYNLALSYQHDSTLNLSIGRKVNRNVSSIGAIDGLQVEKRISNDIFIGGIIGFKPDISEYVLNTHLLEYGVYLGIDKRKDRIYNKATFGVMEQMNSGNTDRRYLYFQTVNNFGRKFSVFSSTEMDLYQRVNNISKNELRLTNLLVSLRYRFSRKFSVAFSYDNRKRIIYYETLRTEVERLLADDEARQGIRARVSFRPFKFLNGGINYSRRFQVGERNKSDNINTYFTISKIPIIEGSIAIRYNRNISNYLTSNVYSIRYSNSIFRKRLYTQFYYRLAQYDYFSYEDGIKQRYYGVNLYYRISKLLRLGILGEMSERDSNKNYRVNTKISHRF